MSKRSIGKRNKERGYELEREIVQLVNNYPPLKAVRTWGSDGRSRGLPKEVDILVEAPCGSLWIQAKRRKTLASYIKPEQGFINVVREDRGEPLAILPLKSLLPLIRMAPIDWRPHDI